MNKFELKTWIFINMGGAHIGPTPLPCFYSKGSFFEVKLDAANFHEGSIASGVISFELLRNTPALSVFLTIIGSESVMWK